MERNTVNIDNPWSRNHNAQCVSSWCMGKELWEAEEDEKCKSSTRQHVKAQNGSIFF